MDIDYDRLRQDLIDFFGPAAFIISPIAFLDLDRVEKTCNEELIRLALDNGFDLNNYRIITLRKK